MTNAISTLTQGLGLSFITLLAMSGCVEQLDGPSTEAPKLVDAPQDDEPDTDGGGDGVDGGDGGDIDDPSKQDLDGDGYTAEFDCNDNDSRIHPGATEVCDGQDNDCDALTDDADDDLETLTATTFWQDSDGDGHGDVNSTLLACTAPAGFVGLDDDCDDNNELRFPGNAEICDSIDNDCDAAVDDADDDTIGRSTFFADADLDGFGDAANPTMACEMPAGFVTDFTDCDDASAAAFPGNIEQCDDVDNDCDGRTDEADVGLIGGTPFWADRDGDGFGDPSASIDACAMPNGTVDNSDDCDDGDHLRFPGTAEVCDGIDNDCDGDIDDADSGVDTSTGRLFYQDSDGDGDGAVDTWVMTCAAPVGFTPKGSDCDDGNVAVFAGATEVCDGIDNNCDGTVDDDDAALDISSTSTWYADSDYDGHGDSAVTVQACEKPVDFVALDDDCDDAASDVYPGAVELCNGIDDDCDSGTSEDSRVTLRDGVTGDWSEITSTFTGAVTADSEGTIEVCGGTWNVNVDVQADINIRGYNDPVLNGGGTGPVLSMTTDGVHAIAQNLTMTGGLGTSAMAAGEGFTTAGGAVSCNADASVELQSINLLNNQADIGGAIASDGCDVDLAKVTILGNDSTEAGAIYINNGDLRWAEGTLGPSTTPGVTSIQLGQTGESSAMVHGILVSNHTGTAIEIGPYGALTASGDVASSTGFFDNGTALSIATGGSFRSLGSIFGDLSTGENTVDIDAADTGSIAVDGSAWLDCTSTGCGDIAITGGAGTMTVESGVGTTMPADLDCTLEYEVVASPSAAVCPDCEFGLEVAFSFVESAPAESSCADRADGDSSMNLAFAPDYLGYGAGMLMYDTGYGWMPTFDAEIIGSYLVFDGSSLNQPYGYDAYGTPTYESTFVAGELVLY